MMELSNNNLLLAASLLLLPLLYLLTNFIIPTKSKAPPLPPGPRGVPILGCLPLLGPLPHRRLLDLSKTYGPIMHLRIGSSPTIVVSSSDVAELFLKTHDIPFANRPPSEILYCLSYGHKSFAFTDHGPYWRNMRKLCVTHLLSAPKINSFRSSRSEEVKLFIEKLTVSANAREAVNVSEAIGEVVSDVVSRMMLGRKYSSDDEEWRKFMNMTRELLNLLGVFNINDAIPMLGVFDFQRMRKRMKEVHDVFDEFLEKIIDEHESVKCEGGRKKEEGGELEKDFVDVMLSFVEAGEEVEGERLDRTTVKANVLDLLEASLDTMRTPIEWGLTELIRHPRIMKKLQDEIQSVVGAHRLVEETDLQKLDYLNMVVKETLRLHPLAAFLFHYGKEECKVSGYRIPKGASVMISLWALGRDPNVWPNVDEFMPERFVDNGIDFKGGNDFRLLSFGSGRRSCAGMQLALALVPLVLAQLVHCFDWELPQGMLVRDLDMMEVYGFTMPRAQQLWAVPTQRLQSV